ncbi:MAG: lipase/acyltransferase domain-containing protein [Minisyncoccota bacterium]
MRARTLIISVAFIGVVLATSMPLAVHAKYVGEPEPEIYSSLWTGMGLMPDAMYDTRNTALRTGDAPSLLVGVHSSYNPSPEVSVDFSSLGYSSIETATGTWGGYGDMQHYPSWWQGFALPALGAAIADGLKIIPITATDALGNTATATARIMVDNTPPTVSLSSIIFSTSTTSPKQGDYMYLTGSMNGTGTKIVSGSITETLLDVNKNERGPWPYHIAGYDFRILIASSTNGVFTKVPIYLNEGGVPGDIAASSFFRIDISVYDEAGNLGTTTLTVPVPKLAPDPCAAPGSCISNVLFLPGIEGSRLYYRGALGIEHQVWEPDYHTDIPYLAMNADGTSKYQLYTKDIVDKIQAHNPLWSTIANIFRNNLEAYSSFESSMNSLVASSTFGLKEWKAYPYDWRYDVRDIVQNGTPTEMPDGSIQQVYLRKVLEEMASSSPTGKVTIVAHSNGGLLAKALALSLGADAPKYIDRIVMIGTPQWGTPSDIGAMLHGDDGTNALGIISNSSDIRAAAETMPAVYGLLPSPAYFAHVSDPVVTFDASGLLSGKFAANFGSALSSFTALKDFITDTASLDSQVGSVTDLRTPLALSGTLADKAVATHAMLDAWIPPAGITATAIAGWGQDTTKTLAYTTSSKVVCTHLLTMSACADAPELEHTPVLTQDGDDTVVSPSAVENTGDGLYFNTKEFENQHLGKIVHQNLTAAAPIQTAVAELLKGTIPAANDFIKTTAPTGGTNPIKLRISSHSPVNIVVTDASGNQSGVLPIPGTDFSGVKRDIIGSSVQVFDDEQYVNVPQSGTYQVVASGYAAGSATLDIDSIGSDGTVTATTTFANIPTTASSTVTLSVASGTSTAPSVDLNGDGTADFTAISSSASTDPLAYARYIRTVIASLSLSRGEKSVLDGWLRGIEQQIAYMQKEPHSKWQNAKMRQSILDMQKLMVKARLDMLKRHVEQQVALASFPRPRGFSSPIGISTTEAEIIIGMINQLQALL